MGVIYHRNDALEVNPPQGESNLSTEGSDWLWAVTAVYSLCCLAMYGLSYRARHGEKIFHYLFTVGLLVGSISYFSMASDLGFTVVETQLHRSDAATYQVFFVKYIFWLVEFAVLIIALGLVSGVSWATILFNVTLSWTWVVSYLCSAFIATSYKWGFYVFGTVAWLLLAFSTLTIGRDTITRLGLGRHYMALAGWLNLLWLLYPIAFGVSDGGNVISVTKSLVFFGILDFLMLPVISGCLLFLSGSWDYGRMNLHFTQYGRVPAGQAVFPEKAPAGTTPAAATTAQPAAATA